MSAFAKSLSTLRAQWQAATLPDHARAAYIADAGRQDSEAFVERIAAAAEREHGLATREWECLDERREALAEIKSQLTRYWALDDAQQDYLHALLDEAASPAKD